MTFTDTHEAFMGINDRNIAVKDWADTKAALKALQALEIAKRLTIYKTLFPTNVEGTENLELGAGYRVKAVGKLNYKLASNKTDDTHPIGAVDAMLDAIEKLGPEGKFLAERLIRFTPELSVTEYKNLGGDSPIKKLVDAILTISPGSPEVELIEPKAK